MKRKLILKQYAEELALASIIIACFSFAWLIVCAFTGWCW